LGKMVKERASHQEKNKRKWAEALRGGPENTPKTREKNAIEGEGTALRHSGSEKGGESTVV